MNTLPLAPYIDYEGYEGSHIQSGKELLDIDHQWSTAIYHLMGTFWLTPKTDSSALVDDQLQFLRRSLRTLFLTTKLIQNIYALSCLEGFAL